MHWIEASQLSPDKWAVRDTSWRNRPARMYRQSYDEGFVSHEGQTREATPREMNGFGDWEPSGTPSEEGKGP